MKKRIRMVFALMLAALFLITAWTYDAAEEVSPIQPQADRGVLDLSGWDFEENGNVELNGYWEFYWGYLLEPSDFLPAAVGNDLKPTGFLKVPSPWQGNLDGTDISKRGTGTYRLRIKINPAYAMYGVKTTNIRMTNRLFINGRLAGSSGIPALVPEESVTRNVPYTAFFPSEAAYIDLILQVSDFDYQIGGIVQPIYFGQEKAISRLTLEMIFLDLLAVSTLVMTTFYLFGIYVFRRKDMALLYFAVYCIIFAFFVFTYNEKVFMQLFPSISFVAIMKVKTLLLFVCFAAIGLFIHTNGEQFLPGKILRAYLRAYLIFGLFVLAVPFKVYSEYEGFMFLVAFSANLVIACYLIQAIRKKQYGNLGKAAVQLLCISTLLIIVHFAATLLYNSAILHNSNISLVALLLFVFMISLFISKRHSDAFNAVEALSQSLIGADKTKDEFLINTSHELKTPLHGIINITQSVLENGENAIPPKQAEDLYYVIAIAKRLSSLINDIIDFQSIKSSNLHMDMRTIDINAPVQIVLEVFQRMYQSKNIAIVNKIPHGRYYVSADENRVRQIIYNLVGNALKFTEHGGVEITAARIKGEVVITVRDTGIGIKEELQEIIFNYYIFTSESMNKEYPPSGLGLPIARQLAEHMGGKLWLADTEMGKGSRFCFTLPVVEEVEASGVQEIAADNDGRRATGSESPDRSPDKTLSRKNHTILVVDDEISNIKVIKDIFCDERCEILTAFNGMQALEVVRQNRSISLVLLDVMMPGMSGLEVCRAIREDYNMFDLPVLLLTVKNATEDIAAGFDAGANDFLPKPFDSRELKARAGTLLELRQSVRNSIQAETAFLQSQIKPHFIFNALSVIMYYCYVDGVQAGRLVEEFSNYLRCSFDFNPYSSLVSLETELSLVHSYVAIEKVRYDERLRVSFDVDEILNIISIPALTIQPLVENAIQHGLMKRSCGGKVEVTAKCEADAVIVSIKDDGIGIPGDKLPLLLDIHKASKGVGLKNIHQRLLNLYGQGLQIESGENEGTTVRFKLPYRKISGNDDIDI